MTSNDDNFRNIPISRSQPTSRYYSGAEPTTINSYNNEHNIEAANNATINTTNSNSPSSSSSSSSSSITPNTSANNTHKFNKYNSKPPQIRPEEVIEMNERSVRNGHANIDTLNGFFEEVN